MLRLGTPAVRLFVVGLMVIGLQFGAAADISIAGYHPQLVLAFAAACGAGGGSQRGAVAGFSLGLMVDLYGGEPLGVTAVAYAVAGLVAGYVISITPQPQWWLASMFAAAGAAVGEASLPVVKLLTGQEGWVTTRILLVLAVVVPAAAIVGPLFVPVGRWCTGVKRPKWKAMID